MLLDEHNRNTRKTIINATKRLRKKKINCNTEKNKDKIAEIQKQYYLKHQEQKLQYANEYRAKNKELINEKLREKVLCDVCQCMVSKRNISTHYSCKKHLDNLASTTI